MKAKQQFEANFLSQIAANIISIALPMLTGWMIIAPEHHSNQSLALAVLLFGAALILYLTALKRFDS